MPDLTERQSELKGRAVRREVWHRKIARSLGRSDKRTCAVLTTTGLLEEPDTARERTQGRQPCNG